MQVDLDHDQTVESIGEIATRAAIDIGAMFGVPSDDERINSAAYYATNAVGAALGCAEIHRGGILRLGACPPRWDAWPPEQGIDEGDREIAAAGRAAYIVDELRRVGSTELYDDERSELATLSERIGRASDTGDIVLAAAQAPRLEAIFALAQAGMRLARNDPQAHRDWASRRERVQAIVNRVMAEKSQVSRFLAGEIPASDLDDQGAAATEIERLGAPLKRRLAEAEAAYRQTLRDFEPYRRALERIQNAAGNDAGAPGSSTIRRAPDDPGIPSGGTT